MRQLGIEHHSSTPLWPQGNAEVESFNKPLEKAIRTLPQHEKAAT